MPDPDVLTNEPEVVQPEGDQPEATTGDKHPLAPGGARFEQVYARMREAEADSASMRERLAALEGRMAGQQQQQQQAAPEQPKFYTAKELEAFVEAGQMSQLEAADRLAWQRQQEGLRVAARQREQETKLTRAGDEVRSYIGKIPNLTNSQSEEFRRLATVAYDVAEDMGFPVGDARVQRRALREVFGPVEKLGDKSRAREFDRRSADTFTDTSRGGAAEGEEGPLAHVPKEYIADWKRRGYTKDQMLAEAKYVKPSRRFS